MHVSPYAYATGVGSHTPDRPRKLLLHRDEIRRLKALIDTERVSLVPMSLYFKDGRVKVEIGVGKGRTKGDKRQSIAARDIATRRRTRARPAVQVRRLNFRACSCSRHDCCATDRHRLARRHRRPHPRRGVGGHRVRWRSRPSCRRPPTATSPAPTSTGRRPARWREYYRERKMMAVVFTVDCTTAMGVPPVPNDEIAQAAADNPDALIAFGSVDPHLGRAGGQRGPPAGARARREGVQVPPQHAGVLPQRRAPYYPIYEAIAEHGCIALFHTGQTGIGANLPGGGGIKLKYSNPMHIDDVAADFPGLQDHPGPPFVPVAGRGVVGGDPQAGRLHRPVGMVAEVLPAQPVRYANTLLQDKVLFGSDFPLITPDRWIADFETLEIKDHGAGPRS